MGWRKRKRGRKFRRDNRYGFPQLCVAFGVGLLLAMFGSVKLALVIAAIAIICLAGKAR